MTATEQVVAIAVALHQFLKRTGHSDYRRFAKNGDEAYAGENLRDALITAGTAPR
jgi:hypothetical protein